MSNLGVAGCRNSDGSFCSFCEKTLNAFFCSKYWLDLETHWSGEPWRVEECGDCAAQHSWAKILKNKK